MLSPVPIKRLPTTTPFVRMGLSAEETRLLTPAASKVTKADLTSALGGKMTPAFLGLTLNDLNSISAVYRARAKAPTGGGGTTTTEGGGGCCCCCIACCCCCCAAAVVPGEATVS